MSAKEVERQPHRAASRAATKPRSRLALLLAALLVVVPVAVLLAGCDSSSSPASDGAGGTGDGAVRDGGHTTDGGGGGGDGAGPAGDGDLPDAPAGACTPGAKVCAGLGAERVCEGSGAAASWRTNSCGTHRYCLEDKTGCQDACLDECAVGQTRSVGGKTQTCALYSAKSKAFIALGQSMRDRARRHNGWMRRFHLPNGYVAEARYTDTKRTKASTYHGFGDAAIWTGSYLAAEALRVQASRSPEALASVKRLVSDIDELFAITGHVGYMARFWAPTSSGDPAIDGLYKASDTRHHATTFQGKAAFWDGNTSRDQYQGIWMGWSLAYEVLAASPTHRELIRKRVVAIAEELMKTRKQMQVTLRFKLGGNWTELPLKIDMSYVILNPTEFKNGGPFIQIGSDAGSTDLESSEMTGLREFIPDLGPVLKQIPLLGGLFPASVPRSGSAIMTASIFRIALQVTEGVGAYAARRAKIKAFHDANVGKWLALAKQYVSFNDASQCWKSYYGLNIVFEPIYTLLRLEKDNPARHTQWARDVLGAKLWTYVKDHKNVFFSYIAATHGSGLANAALVTEMKRQLSQFPEPPKIANAVNNAGKYTANSKCSTQTSTATDVGDRVMSDFIWQRHPFTLSSGGDPLRGYPGVDYLLAYWLGRQDGHLAADNPDTCLRFK